LHTNFRSRTVRADIRLDIRKITDVSQIIRTTTDTRSKPCSQIRSTDIRMDIGNTNIRARSLLWISMIVRIIRHGHPLGIFKRISALTVKLRLSSVPAYQFRSNQ